MATLTEIENRLITVEQKIAGAVDLPKNVVSVYDTEIADKTGWGVYGEIAGINEGLLFVGVSLVASPTLDSHIQKPFIFKAF